MGELALLLKILTNLNATTPVIVGVINMIKGGRAAGKTDEQIEEESMGLALETRNITATDMGSQP